MTRRLIAILTLGVFTALVLVVVPPLTGAHAVTLQTAATATSTATATATTAAATATATVSAATAVATATTGATSAATATSVPLAAYPAPVTSASAVRTGGSLTFRWTVLTRSGVKGFNLFAGTYRLNATLIKAHASHTYHKTVPYHPGHPALRIVYKNGRYATIRL